MSQTRLEGLISYYQRTYAYTRSEAIASLIIDLFSLEDGLRPPKTENVLFRVKAILQPPSR